MLFRERSKGSILRDHSRIDRRAEKRPRRLGFFRIESPPPLKDIRLLEAARERHTIRIIVVATNAGGRFPTTI